VDAECNQLVAVLGDGLDVVARRGEADQLLATVAALVAGSLEDLEAVLGDLV
jgi:hypothetical protein